jgi:ATP-dependent DNA helicase RecQ
MGPRFPPDYRLLRPLMDAFPQVPRLALTATADRHTRADILEQLGIPADGLIVAGFDRPNIQYRIAPRDNPLRQILRSSPTIPARASSMRPPARKWRSWPSNSARTGRRVLPYHAGLPAHDRAANQEAFVSSEDMVIVATVAFGMGIDKPDVRFVAHAGLPKSIEGYYQETGRAGRDGDPSVALMLWGRTISPAPASGFPKWTRPAARANAPGSTRWPAWSKPPAAARSCCAISAKTRPRRAAIATIAWNRRP